MNPKYQTIVVNVFSEDMILGKVETMSRDVRERCFTFIKNIEI